MMAVTMKIPREYGYVVLVLILYGFFNFWMGIQVGKALKKYKVFYPTLYIVESENKDTKLFNYMQRRHQNSLEMMSVFFAMLLVSGFQHPVIVVALGASYIVVRFFYYKGYATGVPEKCLKIGYG